MTRNTDHAIETNGTENGRNWSMGLRGYWSVAANVSAVVLICGAFLYILHEQIIQAREDRGLYRQSLESLHKDHMQGVEAIRDLRQSVDRLDRSVDRLDRTITRVAPKE